ncbi:YiiX/YebB-like N1pC/P60 family cysteine hydrolase [Flaviaesturariibacter amylovorans]|uniref:YiiX family permuted papain-like enzyme n=1 Tax=Flaviaesturariibacter amylovorans TaxID=1084520 RepID=A0ABP8H1D6_9BACT
MRTLLLLLPLFVLAACSGSPTPVVKGVAHTAPAAPAPDLVQVRLDSLKAAAQPGDLVLRLGDDMLSHSIRYLSATDPSYSHAGVVVEQGGAHWVAHIAPDEVGRDTIRHEPLDSFLNPKKNLSAGLYRYGLSEPQRLRFLEQIDQYARRGVHFDRTYDLRTEDRLYCSELVARSLAAASGGALRIREDFVPEGMRPLMYAYFANEPIKKEEFATRRYISLDQLYLHPSCRPVLLISFRNP